MLLQGSLAVLVNPLHPPQVTKHALETQKEFEMRAREEELKEKMMEAKREVSE